MNPTQVREVPRDRTENIAIHATAGELRPQLQHVSACSRKSRTDGKSKREGSPSGFGANDALIAGVEETSPTGERTLIRFSKGHTEEHHLKVDRRTSPLFCEPLAREKTRHLSACRRDLLSLSNRWSATARNPTSPASWRKAWGGAGAASAHLDLEHAGCRRSRKDPPCGRCAELRSCFARPGYAILP